MGFSYDPGPLPFVTVRDAKWQNRLEGTDWVGIHGEHGCSMPYQIAKVRAIRSVDPALVATLPLPAIYRDSRALVYITLAAMPEEERIARGIPAEKP
jgi:hypothetical protein